MQSVSCRVAEVRFVLLDGLNLCSQNVTVRRDGAARPWLAAKDFVTSRLGLKVDASRQRLVWRKISLRFLDFFFSLFNPKDLSNPTKRIVVKAMTDFFFF